MPENNSELFGFLVKELIDRITSTQEQLTEIAKDHETRITTIELSQKHGQEADEKRSQHKERIWAAYGVIATALYSILYLLDLLHIFPPR